MSIFKLTNFFLKLYCTFFYIGCIKFAPGTFGTLIAIPLYLIFLNDLPFIVISCVRKSVYASLYLKSVFNETKCVFMQTAS